MSHNKRRSCQINKKRKESSPDVRSHGNSLSLSLKASGSLSFVQPKEKIATRASLSNDYPASGQFWLVLVWQYLRLPGRRAMAEP